MVSSKKCPAGLLFTCAIACPSQNKTITTNTDNSDDVFTGSTISPVHASARLPFSDRTSGQSIPLKKVFVSVIVSNDKPRKAVALLPENRVLTTNKKRDPSAASTSPCSRNEAAVVASTLPGTARTGASKAKKKQDNDSDCHTEQEEDDDEDLHDCDPEKEEAKDSEGDSDSDCDCDSDHDDLRSDENRKVARAKPAKAGAANAAKAGTANAAKKSRRSEKQGHQPTKPTPGAKRPSLKATLNMSDFWFCSRSAPSSLQRNAAASLFGQGNERLYSCIIARCLDFGRIQEEIDGSANGGNLVLSSSSDHAKIQSAVNLNPHSRKVSGMLISKCPSLKPFFDILRSENRAKQLIMCLLASPNHAESGIDGSRRTSHKHHCDQVLPGMPITDPNLLFLRLTLTLSNTKEGKRMDLAIGENKEENLSANRTPDFSIDCPFGTLAIMVEDSCGKRSLLLPNGVAIKVYHRTVGGKGGITFVAELALKNEPQALSRFADRMLKKLNSTVPKAKASAPTEERIIRLPNASKLPVATKDPSIKAKDKWDALTGEEVNQLVAKNAASKIAKGVNSKTSHLFQRPGCCLKGKLEVSMECPICGKTCKALQRVIDRGSEFIYQWAYNTKRDDYMLALPAVSCESKSSVKIDLTERSIDLLAKLDVGTCNADSVIACVKNNSSFLPAEQVKQRTDFAIDPVEFQKPKPHLKCHSCGKLHTMTGEKGKRKVERINNKGTKFYKVRCCKTSKTQATENDP